MNDTEKTILLSTAIVALAILGGSVIIAEKLSRTLDQKDFWAGSGIGAVAADVHAVTGPVSQILTAWTRA